MIQLDRRMDNKLIFQKNVKSKKLIEDYLEVLEKQKNEINNNSIKKNLYLSDGYKGRTPLGSANTMGVRLSQICFYMFGYKKDKKSFLPSSATQYYNKKGDESLAERGLVNLFSLQFPNPYSNTPDNFKIFFGRLIIKLLLETRIGEKLYIDEMVWFLPFIEEIDENKYEELIQSILEYRKLSYEEKKQCFESINGYERLFANCMHEINYYFKPIFNDFKVFKNVIDLNHNEGNCFKFQHGNTETYRNDAIEPKKKTPGYIILNPEIKEKAKILSCNYSVFDNVETQATSESKEDWVKNLYEFNMLNYIEDIIKLNNKNVYDENTIKQINNLSKVIKNMVYQSRYGSNDGKSFEESLKPFWNLFRENRKTEIISGSGDTDLCLTMSDENSNIYKVNIEAKKTSNRLSALYTTRIKNHIKRNGSKYCIVIAPRFARGVLRDIADTNIVTVEAETLANYCLKECLESEDCLADYIELDKIIRNNLGKDITSILDNMITEKYKCA